MAVIHIQDAFVLADLVAVLVEHVANGCLARLLVNHYDKEEKINHAELTLFELTEDDLYERYDGELTARFYSPEELEEMALKAGLKKIAVFGEFTREEPMDTDERFFCIFGK